MGAEVAIVMGSQSDWPTMRAAAEVLDTLGVAWDARIVSAHRTPERMVAFAKGAAREGFKVIVAGAMFIGRVGPLTLFLLLGERHVRSKWKFPEAEVDVG